MTKLIYPDITPLLEASNVTIQQPVDSDAARIFRKAIRAYNNGQVYNALQTARFALRQARKTGEYCKAYIYGFLAQLKLELNQSRIAKYYCLQAISALQKEHLDYAEDKQYYHMFLKSIG